MPAWAEAVPVPRLVISAMTAPARATAAATRKALCIPAVNVAWLMRMIWLASLGRRVTGYGCCADRDRALDAGQLGGAERGQVRGVPAARQHGADLGGHHRAEDGGAEGAADLHGGGLQAAGHAGQLDGGVADNDVGGADHHRGQAQAQQGPEAR
jgi:hypothetical protein